MVEIYIDNWIGSSVLGWRLEFESLQYVRKKTHEDSKIGRSIHVGTPTPIDFCRVTE